MTTSTIPPTWRATLESVTPQLRRRISEVAWEVGLEMLITLEARMGRQVILEFAGAVA